MKKFSIFKDGRWIASQARKDGRTVAGLLRRLAKTTKDDEFCFAKFVNIENSIIENSLKIENCKLRI